VDLDALALTLSEALGLLGGRLVDHGKRVAYLALTIGSEIGLSQENLNNLRLAALLHDAGISRQEDHERLKRLDWQDVQDHCRLGADLLSGFRPLNQPSEVIRRHHDLWSDLRESGVSEELARLANLVYLADRIDFLIDWDVELILDRHRIENEVRKLAGSHFDPLCLDALQRLSQVEVFWLRLYPHHLDNALDRFHPEKPITVGLDDLEILAAIFGAIVDNKSPYTKGHSKGVAQLCDLFATRLSMPEDKVKRLRIAGLFHDLGKLAVPDSILEKPGSLTADEFQVVKRHPFETYYVLSAVPEIADIRDWAAFHHEKPDGSGYPFHLTERDYAVEHTIVMLSDKIQALIQDRPHRPALEQDQVLDILEHLAASHQIYEPVMQVIRTDYDSVAGRAISGV
jgi:HD-GYP domain-containing protein (c-di-GMP phosphodiesterase class II)